MPLATKFRDSFVGTKVVSVFTCVLPATVEPGLFSVRRFFQVNAEEMLGRLLQSPRILGEVPYVARQETGVCYGHV